MACDFQVNEHSHRRWVNAHQGKTETTHVSSEHGRRRTRQLRRGNNHKDQWKPWRSNENDRTPRECVYQESITIILHEK